MTPADFTAWRKARYSSQAGAAQALGLSPRAIWAYENGEVDVPLVVVLACEALDRREVTTRRRSSTACP
jgi:transcriptional regulator with XRE-family HTH domain